MPPKNEASTSTFDLKPFGQAILLMAAVSSSSKNIFQIVSRYNTLLLVLSNSRNEEERKQAHDEFQLLYNENYANLQKLQEIEKQNIDSSILTARLVSEREACVLRKDSIWSNIKWHFDDKNRKSTLSFFITLGFTFAIIATIFGLATIPFFYTAAFFLPIIMLALGFIGLVTGVTALFLDKKQANEKFHQLDLKLTEMQLEDAQRNQEQASLDFTPQREEKDGRSNTLPSRQGNKDSSCSFFTRDRSSIIPEQEDSSLSFSFFRPLQPIQVEPQPPIDREALRVLAEQTHTQVALFLGLPIEKQRILNCKKDDFLQLVNQANLNVTELLALPDTKLRWLASRSDFIVDFLQAVNTPLTAEQVCSLTQEQLRTVALKTESPEAQAIISSFRSANLGQ